MATTYAADLAFTPESEVEPCPVRPGLKRVKPFAPGGSEALEPHLCQVTDMADGGFVPELFDQGFDTGDLSGIAELQQALARCAENAHLDSEAAATIRTSLEGATIALTGGRTMTVQFVSEDGLIMRKAGPNGLKICGPMTAMNDHGAAINIHADQDVLGTPLVQEMDNRAPELFRHAAPDSNNDQASLMLLNVWIPLNAITRPLVLADSNTLNRPEHQLRFGLHVEGFLDRPEDQLINDIWSFVHHPDQRWYFTSEMDCSQAYIFDTLGTAHGSFIIPGEDVAEKAHQALGAGIDALANQDPDGLRSAAGVFIATPERTTPPLRSAIDDMIRLLNEAADNATELCADGATGKRWSEAAEAAQQRVERKSIEVRVVATVE